MTDEAWIDTVRLARDLGTVSVLLPAGVKTLLDLPHTLFSAVKFALMVLAWDELPEEERPPKRIWQDSSRLKSHFAWVKRERERKYGRGDSGIDDPVTNDAARALIVA